MSQSTMIEQSISRGGQDLTARRILRVGPHKVRLTVKSDSYKFQCFARAEVWNPADLKWNQVHSIPHGKMETEEGLCYLPGNRGENWSHFQKDLAELMRVVREVLE